MDSWRQLANEQFPELKDALLPVETLTDLYSELSRLLEASLREDDDSKAQRVINFALWGVRQTKDESFVHGSFSLFSSIVKSPSLRVALWHQLPAKQFDALKRFFYNGYAVGPKPSLDELEKEYRFTSRPNRALETGRAKKRRAAQRGR